HETTNLGAPGTSRSCTAIAVLTVEPMFSQPHGGFLVREVLDPRVERVDLYDSDPLIGTRPVQRLWQGPLHDPIVTSMLHGRLPAIDGCFGRIKPAHPLGRPVVVIGEDGHT